MPGLALENLTMGFGKRVLFHGVTVSIRAGEILVVTGENGCGKSTLLKIIAGLLRPDEGQVRWSGRLGYAAADANVYSDLTGRENLEFFSGLRGVPADTNALLAQVGLSGRSADQPVGLYSSGMRQRLKLAVSLIGTPELLVWDEPTLAMDEFGEDRVEIVLNGHRQRGGTAVLATNDARAAERWRRWGAGLHLGRP